MYVYIDTYIHTVEYCMHAQSCLILWGSMDCSLTGSSLHGIFQPRILEWVAISSPGGSSWPRDQTCISALAGRFFTMESPGKLTLKYYSAMKKNEILPFPATWMNLEGIMLRERSQRTKSIVWYHLYVESKKYNKLINVTKKKQIHRYREQTSGCQWREGKEEESKRYKLSGNYQVWNKLQGHATWGI